MKNLFSIIILGLILFSCAKEELKFSCNPEIDAIVKSGFVEFSEISLIDFLEYDIELQKAIFRSFPADKKRDFWLEKLDSIVVKNKFNSVEIEHINKLVGHISANYFAIKLDSLEFSQRIYFEAEWSAYAKDFLAWDESKIYFIVNSLCITENRYSQIILEMKEISLDYISGDCTCSTESDYCSDFGGYCSSASCSTTSSGCGWLWSYSCNGAC